MLPWGHSGTAAKERGGIRMKKQTAVLLAVLILFTGFSLFASDQISPSLPASAAPREINTEDQAQDHVFNLPANLRVIEEDAFEGTAVSTLVLPETIERIERGAFVRTHYLSEVILPAQIQRIDADAFSPDQPLTVFGVPGTEAQRWARARGYTFVNRNIRWVYSLLRGIRDGARGLRAGDFVYVRPELTGKIEKPVCMHIGYLPTTRRMERPEMHMQDGYFP